MTDRELLELAAKACRLPECGWMGPAFMYVKDNTFTDWNPLADDGDALRLAVKLRLHIQPSATIDDLHPSVEVYDAENQESEVVEERLGDDHCAATRRAIVRAAAEIGKSMSVA